MAFSVTNTFAGTTTLVAADLDQNFTDLENKFNANIDSSNLSASAGITNAQMANDDFELVVGRAVDGTVLNTANTGYFVVGGMPYDATGGAAGYTILGIEHVLYSSGAATTAMVADLDYGNFTDGWTEIQAGISTGTASGQTREAGFTASVSANATRPYFFILDITTAGVAFAAGDSWALSIKLKRTNGLRA